MATGGEAIAAPFKAVLGMLVSARNERSAQKTARGLFGGFKHGGKMTASGAADLQNAGMSKATITRISNGGRIGKKSAQQIREAQRSKDERLARTGLKRQVKTATVYPDRTGASKHRLPERRVTLKRADVDRLDAAIRSGDTAKVDREWKRIVDREMKNESPPPAAYYNGVGHIILEAA